jgi:16S rRNA (guanine527-N7)-methyltransferase
LSTASEAIALLLDNSAALGVQITAEQAARFAAYLDDLAGWNERANLTAIDEPLDVAVKHFADSLACLAALPGPGPGKTRVVDVGAGAGFPGLPLRIVRPDLDLTLVEATRKKTLFLEHVSEALGMPDVSVVTARVEDLGRDPAHRESYDLATSRAVAALPVLAEYCLPLLRVGGLMVAQKNAGVNDELDAAGRAISILGGRLRPVVEYRLPSLEERRWLVLIDKVRPTPSGYPRRVGMPSKRPL